LTTGAKSGSPFAKEPAWRLHADTFTIFDSRWHSRRVVLRLHVRARKLL
jgi:hypothetical protein